MAGYYTTRQGDTWDSVAKTLLGDEHYMPQLMAENFALRLIVVFPAGVMLRIPDTATLPIAASQESLPPWKRTS